MRHYLDRAKPLAGVLALVLGLTLAAPPAFAAGSTAPAPAAKSTLAASAAAQVAALDTSSAVAPAQAAAPAGSSDNQSFFKSTKGKLAIVLFAGAVGFTAWSLGHDRIKSPIRK